MFFEGIINHIAVFPEIFLLHMNVIDADHFCRGVQDVRYDGFGAVYGGGEVLVGNLPGISESFVIQIIDEQVLVEIFRGA
jgi:hypothetical protein